MRPLGKKNPGHGRTGVRCGVTLQNRYLNNSRIFLKNQFLSYVLGVGVGHA